MGVTLTQAFKGILMGVTFFSRTFLCFLTDLNRMGKGFLKIFQDLAVLFGMVFILLENLISMGVTLTQAFRRFEWE